VNRYRYNLSNVYGLFIMVSKYRSRRFKKSGLIVVDGSLLKRKIEEIIA